MFGTTLLQAEEELADTLQEQSDEGVPDRFQIRLGGYFIADQSTDVLVAKHGVGVNINVQDTFNMDTSSQVFRLDGYYRFTPKHALEFSWYSINNSSSSNQDFQWVDKNITIGASGALDTYFNTDIYKVNYVYSFYHSEKVELALAAGLHVMAIDIGFSGSYDVNGKGSNKGESANVTTPLPVVGVRLAYNISPKWKVAYAVDYFAIGFEGVRGSLSDAMLTVDYRIWSHFGLGMGINATRIRLNAESDENLELDINHDVVGAMLYGTLNF